MKAKSRRAVLTIIKAGLLIFAGLVGIRCIMDPNYSKVGGFISGMLLPFGPEFINYVFKCKMPFRIELLYYFFIIIALEMGISMDLYATVPGFDTAVHFCSGILTALVGYYALRYFKATHHSKTFKALYIMFFSMAIAVTWEFFEFGCDKLLGQHMQELISPGVDDTMFDLLAATIGSAIGGILITVPHLVEYLEKDI